jgi:glycosyltransferase involved in cell wall biosynthesis
LKLVCIPAYNEARTIGLIVKESLEYADKVIVCDDGSTDDTIEIASKNGAEIISHHRNLGKGAAVKSLFNRAKELESEVTVTIDGDGQFLPNEIPKLMKKILEKKSDIVLGYRFGTVSDIPKYRKFGNSVIAKMATLASDHEIRDAETGFRAYSLNAIKKIKFNSNSFGMDAEILVNASKLGLKISEENVTVIYDTGGKTSTKNAIPLFADMASNLLQLIAIRYPLKFLGIPGISLIFLGALFSILTINYFNETGILSLGYTLLGLGSFIGGLMFLLMSIVLFSISKTKSD